MELLSEEKFWCFICKKECNPIENISTGELECNICNGSFIEIIEEEESSTIENTSEDPRTFIPNINTSTSVFQPPALKSISDYNATNPDASSAASSASKIIGSAATRKSSRQDDGIHAKCQRKGCQQVFKINENTPTSCCYHIGQPIFHDAVKFWSCCSQVKCYDFDEFMAVKGCTVGLHDDGVIDIA